MISASGSLCVAFLPNPTDPDAGTNRTNAVSRDNLMNGAGLEYSGVYSGTVLNNISANGNWWSYAIDGSSNSYLLYIATDSDIAPRGIHAKFLGRSVR